jgi:hypothetical protein
MPPENFVALMPTATIPERLYFMETAAVVAADPIPMSIPSTPSPRGCGGGIGGPDVITRVRAVSGGGKARAIATLDPTTYDGHRHVVRMAERCAVAGLALVCHTKSYRYTCCPVRRGTTVVGVLIGIDVPPADPAGECVRALLCMGIAAAEEAHIRRRQRRWWWSQSALVE